MAKKATEGSNGFDREKVEGFVGQIESHLFDLLSERGAYMNRCRGIREGITAVYEDAKAAGIPKKELRTLVQTRELERKAIELRESLEEDQKQTFDMIREALGDFANTPLGEAAVSGAKKRRRRGGTLDSLNEGATA